MTNYVLICVKQIDSNTIALVLKDKPDWQKGRFNIPGGKIEDGETPLMAAERELQEEVGDLIQVGPLELMGLIEDSGAKIFCYQATTYPFTLSPRPEETQQISWHSWYEVKQDPRLIPNLRVIVPLMLSGVVGWVITDDYRSSTSDKHLLQLSIPTYIEKSN